MNVIYMPSEQCPKCPFKTLCTEETICPILHDNPVSNEHMPIRSMIPSDSYRTLQEM
jgi:hypothetical protein